MCVFVAGGRAGGVRTLLQPARAQCLRLSERFFHWLVNRFAFDQHRRTPVFLHGTRYVYINGNLVQLHSIYLFTLGEQTQKISRIFTDVYIVVSDFLQHHIAISQRRTEAQITQQLGTAVIGRETPLQTSCRRAAATICPAPLLSLWVPKRI